MQNDYKEKLRALLEALEAQRIDELMERGKVGDFRNYGKAYVKAVKNKINEKEPLFITDDRIKVFDKNSTVYCITREQFEELAKKHLTALRGYDINQTMGIYGVGKLYDEIVKQLRKEWGL